MDAFVQHFQHHRNSVGDTGTFHNLIRLQHSRLCVTTLLKIDHVCSQQLPVLLSQHSIVGQKHAETFFLCKYRGTHATLSTPKNYNQFLTHLQYHIVCHYSYLILSVASASTTRIIPTSQKRLTIFGSAMGANGFCTRESMLPSPGF